MNKYMCIIYFLCKNLKYISKENKKKIFKYLVYIIIKRCIFIYIYIIVLIKKKIGHHKSSQNKKIIKKKTNMYI